MKADALVKTSPSERELKTKPSKLVDYLSLLKEVTGILDPDEDPEKDLYVLMTQVTRAANEDLKKKVDELKYQDDDLKDSTLFCTTGGYVGLVYTKHKIQPGDLAAILHGCDFPYILRKKDKYWTMIGSAYVSGIMDGEYLDVIREKHDLSEAETFDIV